jgi:anaerobic nitric oxide reductase transcription regulator
VADGGTLFLDEIGELPATIQPKLLRAIQKKEIQRVGSNTTTHVNVRLLAATNRDLEVEVSNGRFREDLFHRLNVYPLVIPPGFILRLGRVRWTISLCKLEEHEGVAPVVDVDD